MLFGLLATLAGIAVLSKAADEFVDGAAGLAKLLKVSPIVIGAVVVGFGTSAPEMVVSGIAATQGDDDLGIGNIIGSNIANLSLILGAAALMIPLTIDSSVLRRQAPLATGAALMFALLLQGGIAQREGLVLLLFMFVGLYLLMSQTGPNMALVDEVGDDDDDPGTVASAAMRTLVGLVATVAGAWVLVWGATTVADELGFNDGFVGITLVAIGTSLPELVTAIAAARAGHDELIVGNLLGSNLFNSLAVGAVVGLLGDGTITDPSLDGADLLFMVIVCVSVFALMAARRTIGRIEGFVLLATFAAFLVLTYLGEASDDAAAALGRAPF